MCHCVGKNITFGVNIQGSYVFSTNCFFPKRTGLSQITTRRIIRPYLFKACSVTVIKCFHYVRATCIGNAKKLSNNTWLSFVAYSSNLALVLSSYFEMFITCFENTLLIKYLNIKRTQVQFVAKVS